MNEKEFYEFENRAEEIWADAPGFSQRYQVSSLGRFRRKAYWHIYTDGQKHFYPAKLHGEKRPSPNGYIIKTLLDNKNEQQHVYLHRLVATAFIPNPDNLPMVNHIDGNRANNCVDNLEWCTQSHNMAHAIRRLGELGPIKLKPVQCLETEEIFESSADAARWLADYFDINQKAMSSNIWMVASGVRDKAGGLHWVFLGDENGVENE